MLIVFLFPWPPKQNAKAKKCFLTVVVPPRLPSAPFFPAPGKLSGCWNEPGGPHGSGNDGGTSCWTAQTSHTHKRTHKIHYRNQLTLLVLTEEKDQQCLYLVFAAPYWYFQVLSSKHAKTPETETQAEGEVKVKQLKLTCLSSSAAPSSQLHPLSLPEGDRWAKTWDVK